MLFTIPGVQADEPVWDGNKVVLVSEKLDDGVFAYYPSDAKELEKQGNPVATSGGFIVGDKGVLLVDTMLNQRLNAQVQELVKKETNKPIILCGQHQFSRRSLLWKHVPARKHPDYSAQHYPGIYRPAFQGRYRVHDPEFRHRPRHRGNPPR
ncbi:MAG: hypothetical protein O6703_05960 [Gammaproteobacteria bacterium]|nr:hypothetical protein [Gammaproteobacteria bacterium]